MTTTVSQEAVEVTQADREAAWPYAGFHCLPDRQMHERWFSGYYDNLGQGQAIRDFARHRQQAERGEVVAWMYVSGNTKRKVFSKERWAAHIVAEIGASEHALYTLPTPPEAV